MTDVSEGIDLAELERLAKAARQGDWWWSKEELGEALPEFNGRVEEFDAAEFIAATGPDTVLALVGRIREAEARVNRVVKLRDLMQKERDDVDVSVRLSIILVDLNAALTEGDEQ